MNTPQTAARIFNWHLPIRTKIPFLLLLLICVLSITLFSGCSDSDKIPASSPLTKEQIQKQKEEEILKSLPKTEDGRYIITDPKLLNHFKSWEIWNNVAYKPEEPLDNKEFWSKTRIMFAWRTDQMVNGKKLESHHLILSVNLDGTDIRQVLPTELLIGNNEASMDHKPVRSPDNRYLVASMTHFVKNNRIYKVLYDLKNMTSEIIAQGGSTPDFNWTPDSKNIIFYLEGDLKNYNIETKTLTDLPMVYSSGGTLNLRDNGKTFVASRKTQLQFTNLNGEKIKVINFPTKRGDSGLHQLSLDSKYFFYSDPDKYIFDVEKQKIVYTIPEDDFGSYDMVFDPYTNEAIYNKNNTGLVKHNFIKDKRETIIPVESFVIYDGSIINYPPIYESKD